jgi:hypothetical protein
METKVWLWRKSTLHEKRVMMREGNRGAGYIGRLCGGSRGDRSGSGGCIPS